MRRLVNFAVLILLGLLIVAAVVMNNPPYKACWPSAVGQECYDRK